MCRSKPQPNSGKYNKQKRFYEENISSEQASSVSEMGMFFTKKHFLSMSVTWESISINNCKVKMLEDTVADRIVTALEICTKLGKPLLDGKIRHPEAYD